MTEGDELGIGERIRQAILERRQLGLALVSGEGRTVEPHAYGYGVDGRLVLWAWCVSATGSESNAAVGWMVAVGWMLCRLGEMRDAQVLAERFPGPQPGYRRSNAQIPRILEQL